MRDKQGRRVNEVETFLNQLDRYGHFYCSFGRFEQLRDSTKSKRSTEHWIQTFSLEHNFRFKPISKPRTGFGSLYKIEKI